ncbi:class I SAM-dependent methyltransferase [Streptosporangium sp. NBC_01469]|uniref:class I SAM-dependent methyltransferase n=1 Tax=Streptosporangium sp. NBC_01469 TaxID=2903898 RepID=UPI002E2A4EBB|nr:class I SAM-dependent methyltransferase [Streptosporangium sp. NBC_01469]
MGLDLVIHSMDGFQVLDAGCGTGHRLVGLAMQYPDTEFLGVDFSEHSLSVARELAQNHNCDNVSFQHAEIGGEHLGRRFDLITSTGVIHHLADPSNGVQWLYRHLEDDGIAYTWYYHPYGEFDRLLSRELVHVLLNNSAEDISGTVLEDLGLALSVEQYGTRTSFAEVSAETQLAADVDAYLHPIVNAYRFQEAADFFQGGTDWTVVHGINWDGGSSLINSGDWSEGGFGTFTSTDLFKNTRLREIFVGMDASAQLHCVELKLRPTGFTLLSGNASGLERCTERTRTNVRNANLLRMNT